MRPIPRQERRYVAPMMGEDAGWQPSTRYADQPMSLGSRLFGLGGVALMALIILAAASFTWTRFEAVQPAPTLSMFDVAPPAPPETLPEKRPDIETPNVPEPHPTHDVAVEPLVLTPSEVAADPISPPPPRLPAEQVAPPQPKPIQPAPPPSDAKPTWEGQVLGALNQVKRYPRLAMTRRQQGVPYIRFVMNRDGAVLSSQLERSSGFPDLDREAISLPKRAAPLPRPPASVNGSTIELVVPVEFFVR